MLELKLQQWVNIDRLKMQVNNNFGWPNSKYCLDKTQAISNEKLFFEKGVSINPIIKVIRPTAKGYYAELKFHVAGDLENEYSVILFIPISYCIIPYNTSLPYFNAENSIDNILPYLQKPGNYKNIPINLMQTITSCEQIERFIPLPSGEFISGGPRRVAVFYYNTILELSIEMASVQGKLKGLGIDELKISDNTHFTFHQGAGNKLPDLINPITGDHYEVKGPLANPANFIKEEKLNKKAKYILHFMKDKTLVLYERQATDMYLQKASINFDFDYPDLNNLFEDSWEKYWAE